MKNFLMNALICLLFFGGLGVILYPSVSNWVNDRNQSGVMVGYQHEVDELGEKKRLEELEKAHAYNKNLLSLLTKMENADIAQSEEYLSTLDVTGDGIMGTIDIDKINVHLPVYHTASNSVLQVAVGHLPETSLPVGGEGTHAILSAHTGLTSAKLFTDLDELVVGDMFKINVLGEVLVYQVDQIKVVEPYDTGDMRIFDGKDYVTLLTCTPYGINSHRLLVRGVRIPYEQAETIGVLAGTDAVFVDKTLLLSFVVGPVVVIYFIYVVMTTPLKVKKKRRDSEKETDAL